MNLNVPDKKIALEREIDFEEIIFIISKNQRILFFIEIISSLISFIFSLNQEVYRGKFKIIVDSSQNKVSGSSMLNELFGASKSFFGLGNNLKDGQNIETKIEILKGPVVLDSVYKHVKEKNEENGDILSFNEWIKNLEVDQVPDTTILEVKYRDNDKKLIIDVLEKISLSYQNYSLEKVIEKIKPL